MTDTALLYLLAVLLLAVLACLVALLLRRSSRAPAHMPPELDAARAEARAAAVESG